ncbi:MAG TPA: cytochrome C [Thermoanaerobaculia bacterium]|nr:cytochrome C [Thermoanaerobaculia bacterium]
MKKTLLIPVIAAALAAVGLAAYLGLQGHAGPIRRPPSQETVALTPARVARGRYLSEHVLICWGCHTTRDWSRFGGPITGIRGTGGEDCLTRDHGFPGTVCPPNVTPDRETGIGAWTDGEVLRALREGVGRDGRALFNEMPYWSFRNLADDDARAVVAYVRTLPPARNVLPKTELDPSLQRVMDRLARPVEAPVPAPDPADHLRYGEYLTNLAGCRFCHSDNGDDLEALPGRAFAGGQEFVERWGTVYSANLTPDETGLKKVTKAEFIGRFRAFANPATTAAPLPDPTKNTVMPWIEYSGMTGADLGAIYDFLRTVRPIANRVVKYPAHPKHR